jgi:hypothetical protein
LDPGRRTLHGVRLFATREGAIGAFGEEIDSLDGREGDVYGVCGAVTLAVKSARLSRLDMGARDNQVRLRLRTRYVS